MKMRKLEQQEHQITRALWESVFMEDTKAFLDYYYSIKTRDNVIYVEEDEKVRSMIQLNPYTLKVEENRMRTHYIIGVATEDAYRRRGLMGELLRKSMQDMYDKKEPFTFLMPAAEAIYTPYDFRFIYNQEQQVMHGARGGHELTIREAGVEDVSKMVSLSQKVISGQFQVYAIRNKTYYETILQEQASQDGGVTLVYLKKKLIGMFAYSNEDRIEIREPLFLSGYETYLEHAVYELTGDEETEVLCYSYRKPEVREEDRNLRPMIMARILYIETLLKSLKTKGDQTMNCSFAIIDPILAGNNRILKLEYNQTEKKMTVQETEDFSGVFTIGAFTSYLFGYLPLEDVAKEEGVVLTDELTTELRKIQTLDKVFLNEIV